MNPLKLHSPFSKPQPYNQLQGPTPALPILRKRYLPASLYVIPRVTDARTGEAMHLDRAAALHPCAVIVGPSGSGKTSALDFVANGASIISLADVHPGALPTNLPADGTILLDGVKDSHTKYLEVLGQVSQKARIFATADDASAVAPGFIPLLLESFNEREIVAAADPWFSAPHTTAHGGHKVVNRAADAFLSALKANPGTRILATNPLNLFLLIQVYTKGVPLPSRRTALFDSFFWARLQAVEIGQVVLGGGPISVKDADFAARALEGIALATKRGQLAKEEHLERGYGFLRAASSGRVEFVHPLLEDFVAARALRRNPELDPLIEHVMDDDWREVVLFYAGLGDARPLVEALLERDLPDLAALALAEAAEIPDDLQKRLVDPMISRAWERQDAGAIVGLGALRSSAATDFFAARLKERDPAARTRAALILGQLNTDRSVEYLLPQLRDTDAGVRDQVVASLAQSTSDRVVEPLLVALRGDSRVGAVDTRMRVAAARALGDVGTEKAVPALIVDLQVGEPEVRAEAVKALIKICSELALKPLRAIVDSNQSSEVREAANQVLERI